MRPFARYRISARQATRPTNLARLLELPESTVEPRFHLVHPREGKAFGFSAFFCKHLTPELLRRSAWLDHPNGATRIAKIETRVPNPAELVPRYRAMFGREAIAETKDGLQVQAGETRLTLRQGLPTIDRLTIGVRDVAATARWLEEAGFSTTEMVVCANGLAIAFVSD